MSKVSIIVPVYNSKGEIKKCIDSILNQTYKNYELILINDGSTDDSISILNEYSKKYSNIKVIDKKNEGVAKTRNLGISIATGSYIMFIDNDDYIDKNYIETYISVIENSDYDMVIGGYRRITEDNKILESKYPSNDYWSRFTIITPWAKIYKRDFIVDNKIEFLDYGIGEDIYFYLQILDKSDKIKAIDYIGYNWFYNTKSISNTEHKEFNNNIDILYLVKKIRKKVNGNNIEKNILNYYCIRLIIWYLLYSGKSSSSDEFINQYNKLFDYLKINYPNYRRIVLFNMPKGEFTNIKMIMKLFIIIEKFHLIKLFSKIYCKGGK